MPLVCVPDHVAAAVPDFDVADRRWRDELGGRWVSWYHNRRAGFRSRQLRFRGGAKLELIQPSEADPAPTNFVRRFLARHGSDIQHVTLKVASLEDAVDEVRTAGLDVVGIDRSDPAWQEAFLRPSQIGGVVVQLAQSPNTDEDWALRHGYTPEPAAPDGAILLGPRLAHPDLDQSAAVWTLLGGEVSLQDGSLLVRWGPSPLTIEVVAGERAQPLGVRIKGAPALQKDDQLGPAVLPVTAAARA